MVTCSGISLLVLRGPRIIGARGSPGQIWQGKPGNGPKKFGLRRILAETAQKVAKKVRTPGEPLTPIIRGPVLRNLVPPQEKKVAKVMVVVLGGTRSACRTGA